MTALDFTKFLTGITAEDVQQISWKVQSTNKEKTVGTLVAYLDGQYYEDRLDAAVIQGVLEGWSEITDIEGIVGAEFVARSTLTFFLPGGKKLTRTGVGAAPIDSGSTASLSKTAATDAFKRACARSGLGRFLYELPKLQAPLENGRYLPREVQEKLPGLTAQIAQDYVAKLSSAEIDRRYKWVLTNEQKADELSKAKAYIAQAVAKAEEVGKATEIQAIRKQYPKMLSDITQARAAYKALDNLIK